MHRRTACSWPCCGAAQWLRRARVGTMAELAISAGRLAWSASTSLGVSVKPYAKATEQVSAFGLPPASAAPVKFGEWEGSVDAGASVNCPVRGKMRRISHTAGHTGTALASLQIVTLCTHSSGTHTECVGHVLPGTVTLSQLGLTCVPRCNVTAATTKQRLSPSTHAHTGSTSSRPLS